ncbi:MAG: hypothetical protein KJS98_05095 [Nitrospirae bacterium]|nr:hypothetical protein [Nitrospirota bacterium]
MMAPNVVGRSVFFLCQLLALLLSAGNALAQTGSLNQSPAEVVKRYLALDYKGARLDALSVDTVTSYTSWHEEPTWGHVVVTRGFVVAEQYRQWEVIDRLEVVIPVTFQVIGSVYLETAGFVQEARTEEVRFRVKAVRNRWRIIEPMLPPHVGQKRMVNVVREAWIKETDQAKRDRLGALQDELRKVK